MATRTVRLDAQTEQILMDVCDATGLDVSGALKKGLLLTRDALRSEASQRPWDVYAGLDLGVGGASRAPGRKAKSAVRDAIARKHRR